LATTAAQARPISQLKPMTGGLSARAMSKDLNSVAGWTPGASGAQFGLDFMEYHQLNNFFLEQRRIGVKKKANAPDSNQPCLQLTMPRNANQSEQISRSCSFSL
jgi:hypothetical protein